MSNLDDIKDMLRKVGLPIAGDDLILREIVDKYVDWVDAFYSMKHYNTSSMKHYDDKNLEIVANVLSFEAHLQDEKWKSSDLNQTKSTRDHLIEKNKLYRAQAGLKALGNNGVVASNEHYCMEPFIERDIKVAIDFDEARATGGSCHAEEATLAYKVVDFDEAKNEGYVMANITEQEYEEWRADMLDLLRAEDIGEIRIRLSDTEDERDGKISKVEEFTNDWAAKRLGLLELKQDILEQRLLERQIKELKANNEALLSMLKGDSEDSSGILADVRMGPRGLGPDRIIDQEAKDLPEDEED